ncbi:hypothetical protein HK405_014246, partial [Cladochytrium tenue]
MHAATLTGFVVAALLSAAVLATSAVARNPALVVLAALLLAMDLTMLLNGTVVQARFDAALAANATSASPTVVAYQDGLTYLVMDDPVFQGFCDFSVRLHGVYIWIRTMAYLVNNSYCDEPAALPLTLTENVVMPILFSFLAATATVLSILSYARKRREIINAAASNLFASRFEASADITGWAVNPITGPVELHASGSTPQVPLSATAGDSNSDSAATPKTKMSLHFIQRLL